MSDTITVTAPQGDEIRAELLSAGPALGLDLGNRALGISKAHGYRLAKQGKYPVPLLKVGAGYRIITADLLALLRIQQNSAA